MKRDVRLKLLCKLTAVLCCDLFHEDDMHFDLQAKSELMNLPRIQPHPSQPSAHLNGERCAAIYTPQSAQRMGKDISERV